MTAKTILIADDDAELRAVVRALLSEEFIVLEASNGREAAAAAAGERPDVVLLDIAMPQMSGVEALVAIRAANPAALVIMLTSETDIETAKKTLELGAAAFVTKPFDMELLRAELRRIVIPEPADDGGRPWRVRA